jgi:hypothetical protein
MVPALMSVQMKPNTSNASTARSVAVSSQSHSFITFFPTLVLLCRKESGLEDKVQDEEIEREGG